MLCCLLLILVLVWISIYHNLRDLASSAYHTMFGTADEFKTKRDKSAAIYQWFKQTPKPTFTIYKSAVPGSDIIEYERVLALQQQGKLTLANVNSVV